MALEYKVQAELALAAYAPIISAPYRQYSPPGLNLLEDCRGGTGRRLVDVLLAEFVRTMSWKAVPAPTPWLIAR